MRPSFQPRLINDPLGDPGLFVPFRFENRALLFDLGDIHSLSPKDILKISHIFISHTHMDHFIGFDHLLRLFLGRKKRLCLYGPEGIIRNVTGKLSGYTWNLVGNYTDSLELDVIEVGRDESTTRKFKVEDGFSRKEPERKQPFEGRLVEESEFMVNAVGLDHGIPSLAFSLEERFHVNILKPALEKMGLEVGPWLTDFKAALFAEDPPETVFSVPSKESEGSAVKLPLGELASRIARITPGQKIVYIADASYSEANREKMISLARNADHLFIEAAFLDEEKDIAYEKFHLTARQAGTIAAEAGAKQMTVFHFSPRYTDKAHLLEEEAQAAFS